MLDMSDLLYIEFIICAKRILEYNRKMRIIEKNVIIINH